MDPTTTRTFLRALGVAKFGRARTGWVTCACPLAPWRHPDGSGKASFGLKTSANLGANLGAGLGTGLGAGPAVAKCFSCDFVGSPAELLYEMLGRNRLSPAGRPYDFPRALAILADESRTAATAIVTPTVKSIDEATYGDGEPADFVFPESWLAGFEPAHAGDAVHPYLAARGVPVRVASDLDLRFDAQRRRVCFPVRDVHGRLRGLHGRSIDAHAGPAHAGHDHAGLRYLMYTLADPNDPAVRRCNPDIWLGEAWVDPDRPVVVVESVFDLARVFQCYRNVMTPLTASLNAKKLARLAGIATLVPMFDADKAGALALATLARAHVLRGTAILPVQSIGGFKDPGAAPVEVVAGILAKYVALDPILE